MENNMGKYIKEKRLAAGLTQKELSDALGYNTPQFVSIMERGHAKIPRDTAIELGAILKFNPGPLVKMIEKQYLEDYRRRGERRSLKKAM